MVFEKKRKSIYVECPYAEEATKDFCDPKHPWQLDMAAPDAEERKNAHIERHATRRGELLGKTLKRLGCQICDWTSDTFVSNNSMSSAGMIQGDSKKVLAAQKDALLGTGKGGIDMTTDEEAKAREALHTHMSDHPSCSSHVTPGEEKLTYYFRDDTEKLLHMSILHKPKVKPMNKPRETLGRDRTTFFRKGRGE